MTEEKKSSNPFINQAREARKATGSVPGRADNRSYRAPKPNSRGFGAPSVVRRSGRGG